MSLSASTEAGSNGAQGDGHNCDLDGGYCQDYISWPPIGHLDAPTNKTVQDHILAAFLSTCAGTPTYVPW